MAERASEVTELKRNLAQALRDKEQLQEVKQQHRVHNIYTAALHSELKIRFIYWSSNWSQQQHYQIKLWVLWCSVWTLSAAIPSFPHTPHHPLINTSILASFAHWYSAIRQCKCHATCLFHPSNPGLNVKPDSSALMKSSREEVRGEISRGRREVKEREGECLHQQSQSRGSRSLTPITVMSRVLMLSPQI